MTDLRTRLKKYRKCFLLILVCLGGILLLKWGVLSGYTIPTPSMEPTFIGNADNGDKIAVFKLFYKLFSPSRYDLCVFFKEGVGSSPSGLLERSGGTYFVKRIVGLPGETLMIKDGDLYIGNSPYPHRKPMNEMLSLMIPVYRAEFDGSFFENWKELSPGDTNLFTVLQEGLKCSAFSETGTLTADLVFAPPGGVVCDDYLTMDGNRHAGRHPVNDVGLNLDVKFLEDAGELYAELREGSDIFRFVL